MLGSIILMFMCMWILSLIGGMLLGKLLWTPPVNGVK